MNQFYLPKASRLISSAMLLAILSAAIPARGSNTAAQAATSTQWGFPENPTADDFLRAHFFAEPLVPVGGEPDPSDNAALARALKAYAQRTTPDDFSSLTRFLDAHPRSPWAAALLTDLGLEYYNTAHYSLALKAWAEGWALAKDASDPRQKVIGDRAASELAYMYARLGRMTELEDLLNSLQGRTFVGQATEKITGAREGLWNMKNHPEISFRCGPLALYQIEKMTGPQPSAAEIIHNSASTQKGFSLVQVAQLSEKIGLNYQMAFRQSKGQFIVPSVVHWKVGHYGAIVRSDGERYLVQDPTFRNDVWATRQALEAETDGYFLIPPGPMSKGWRSVAAKEGETIWGKGIVNDIDPKPLSCRDPQTPGAEPCGKSDDCCKGMAVSSVHLSTVSLDLKDQPVGYAPPVGPDVEFQVRYNQRDAFQPGTFSYANFGPKWTCDWIAYITDNPQSSSADVNYYIRGGGVRVFTGFDGVQTYAAQQYDQTQLKRIGPASYEMLWPDGSKLEFANSDGSIGTSRNIFLTQVIDPQGNAVTLNYDSSLRLTNIVDAIGQVTTVSYGLTNDIYKITKVTDPFGRFASFGYDSLGRLTNITDVIGLTSQFTYATNGDFVNSLITPYGTSSFTNGGSGLNRSLDTVYPDGSHDRVEYNVTVSIPESPLAPQGMMTDPALNFYRNTYYWSRNAYALGAGDYTKARVYHWCHSDDFTSASGMLESAKEPLENRVYMDYAGQPASYYPGSNNRPLHIGRVLDDGSTQLYQFSYNGLGNVTSMVDPIGRTFSCIYDVNGIDLLEVRQTRAGNNDLLFKATYNTQHLPLTITDASGQMSHFTYNARGQILTFANPRNETNTFTYNANGYCISALGPLPGTNDMVSFTYDAFGRGQTFTDMSGYTITAAYDLLDRPTNVSFPDSTSLRCTYNRLDPVLVQDRAGRQTTFAYDSLRHMIKRVDSLGRTNLVQWCSCGKPSGLTDALGHTTTWQMDIQDRITGKRFADGSQINYVYENSTGRVRERIDEKLQTKAFVYNIDDTLNSVGYGNTAISTPSVAFTYDPNYRRVNSISDGIGTTTYTYQPVGSLGAMSVASVSGPWTNDTASYLYDELGRMTNRTINGISQSASYDALQRLTNTVDVLGSFSCAYDGSSSRITDISFPGGQTSHFNYFPNTGDDRLQQITHRKADSSLISQFSYAYDVIGNITNWSQQLGTYNETWAGAYDAADRLTGVLVNQAGTNVVTNSYTYDGADNSLAEQAGQTRIDSQFNALNQRISAPDLNPAVKSYEWDGENRLTAIVQGTNRSEFTYDGSGRLRRVIERSGGIALSERRFGWCGSQMCEELDTNDSVVARFLGTGEQRNGTNYYYFSDHLGSVREFTDAASTVHAEYAYTPFGTKTRLQGDLDSNFGFTHLLNHAPSGTLLAVHRVYDPAAARWLSRDPIGESGGMNLYVYVVENPLNSVDPLGFCDETETIEKTEKTETTEETEDMTEELEKMLGGGAIAADIASELAEAQELKLFGHAFGEWGGLSPWEFEPSIVAEKYGVLGKGLKRTGIVFDLAEFGIDAWMAHKCKDFKHVKAAFISGGSTILLILVPEVGLPVKALLFLNDLAGPSVPPWEALQKQAEYWQALQNAEDPSSQNFMWDFPASVDPP